MGGKRGRAVKMGGIVEKPPGMTRTGVVNRGRRGFDAQKAGYGGTLDPLLPDVAEHVDRRRREVDGTRSSGNDEHLLSLFAETQCGAQTCEACTDDHRVVAHAGRCSTSRMP